MEAAGQPTCGLCEITASSSSTMESFPHFFRVRTITFSIIMLLSFFWLCLLCIEMFARWRVADQISHSLMVLFVLTNSVTLIMLPVLILVEFRIWLDAARLFLLFTLQLGSAAAGTYWDPKIQCPHQTSDDIDVCQLIGVYTMIACWIIPTIFVLYSTYFAIMVYLQSRIPVIVEPERGLDVHPEMGSTDSLSSWKEMMKGVTAVQGSNTTMNVSPRLPVMPNGVHAGQPIPYTPCRQSTMPSLAHTSQQPLLPSHSLPGRHCSLPASRQGNLPHLHPAFALTIPSPLSTEAYPSYPSTSSSSPYSPPSSVNAGKQSFSFGPGVAEQSFGYHQRRLKYLSMPSTSSPREMENAAGSPRKTKLSKPLPAHVL